MNIPMNKISPIIAGFVLATLVTVGVLTGSSVVFADTDGGTSNNPQDKNNPLNNPVATYTLLEPLPCLNDGTQKCAENTLVEKVNFGDYVRYIFNLIIALSAVAAVLVIVAGGFKYVTTDSFLGKNEGKKMIFQALQGLLLVLCSYLILRTIDPRLVDIPSTLVKPLDIKYEKGATVSFFSQLSKSASSILENDLNSLGNKVTNLIRANNAINEEIQDLKNSRAPLVTEAINMFDVVGEDEVIERCNDTDLTIYEEDLCQQIIESRDTELTLRGTVARNTGVGMMMVAMKDCIASGGTKKITYEDCHGKIDSALGRYTPILQETGQPQMISEINDFAEYSKAMSNIYLAIGDGTSWDPYAIATINTLQSFTHSVAIVGGTYAGGVVGAGIGYVAGGAVTTALGNTFTQSVDRSEAAKVISSIQAEVNAAVHNKTIKDPDTLAKFKEQSYAIIKAFGGKGDGTDTVISSPFPGTYNAPYGGLPLRSQ